MKRLLLLATLCMVVALVFAPAALADAPSAAGAAQYEQYAAGAAQYEQYAAGAAQYAAGAAQYAAGAALLPDTGGPSLLLPAVATLLVGGALVRIVAASRRNS